MPVSVIFEGTGDYFQEGVLSGHGEKASCSLQWVVLNLIIYCGGCTISVFNQSKDDFLRKLTMLSIMWLNAAFAGFDHQFFRKHTEGYYRWPALIRDAVIIGCVAGYNHACHRELCKRPRCGCRYPQTPLSG